MFKSQSATLQKWKLTLNTHASIDRFSTYEQQFEVVEYHTLSLYQTALYGPEQFFTISKALKNNSKLFANM